MSDLIYGVGGVVFGAHIEITTNCSDVDRLPELIVGAGCDQFVQITVGDLHGNAMKLMYILVCHGITDISAEDYTELARIYRISAEVMTQKDLARFVTILNKIDCKAQGVLRLIGYELADRGRNDYFTLKLLEKLDKSNVNVEILFSNHGFEFIDNYENNRSYYETNIGALARSMRNMQTLLDRGLIQGTEIRTIVETTYKKSLKAVSYTLNQMQDKILIYSHAPINLNTIEAMAKQVGVSYNGDTAIGLAQSIDLINEKFQDYLQQDKVHELCRQITMSPNNGNPFVFIIWNRVCDFHRPKSLKNADQIDFIHGHDSSTPSYENIYNLDNDFGKVEGAYSAVYSYIYVRETT